MRTIQPLNDNVAIKLCGKKDKSPGGIILPDSTKKKSRTGTVFAITNKISDQFSLKCGDTVVVAEYSGTELNIDGLEITIIDIKDILVRLG